jgi:energy-coupling factor transport system substrate-specific component
MRAKDIALIGMMSAIMITAQVALSFLPNIELVSMLIILYTLIFGWRALYIIYVFVAVEGLIYGFGLWFINYLYVWTVLFVLVLLLRKLNSAFLWAVISGLYGLCYGALCSIPYFITGGPASGFAYWVQGVPFDLLHGAGNLIVMLILYHPLYSLLTQIKKRMELI